MKTRLDKLRTQLGHRDPMLKRGGTVHVYHDDLAPLLAIAETAPRVLALIQEFTSEPLDIAQELRDQIEVSAALPEWKAHWTESLDVVARFNAAVEAVTDQEETT